MESNKNYTLKKMLLRGLRRKCPNCGEGRLFTRWLNLPERCANCQTQMLKSRGDIWAFFLIFDRLFLIPIIGGIYFSLMPRDFYELIFSFGAIIILFLITTPNRYGFCIAIDYYTRVRWKH